jgi:GNAT superfamily N-acetyltransferase
MKIREARKEDVEAIHGLIVELAVYEKEPDAVINTPHQLSLDLFETPIAYALVLEKDGLVVGFALYYFSYSTWKGKCLYLEDFYIQPQHRRGGWGQKLFNAVVNIAKEHKVARMDWQVLEWNEPAIQFYQKNNAILDDEWLNGRLYFV